MKRILFLWDAEAFGGHDVSALVALERLTGNSQWCIGVLHTGRNARLTEALEAMARKMGRLDVVCAKAASTASESIDGLIRGPRTRSLQKAVEGWQPDWAVQVQGFITLGLCALAACRAQHVPSVSFVPMTHRVWTLQRSLISIAQDGVNRYWYSVPAAFITTSNRMKEKLVREQKISAERVAVVEYGPALPIPPAMDRTSARAAGGLLRKTVVGVIGRVEFNQKRQDFLIRSVVQNRELLADFQFVIVGDGPDLPAAKRMAADLRAGDQIQFMPWQKHMSQLYSVLDVVLIPSRYEGVPLVMLEAMARRIPVLASNVDGMADFLPEACLFKMGDSNAMTEKLLALPESPGRAVLDRLASVVETRLNETSFAARFEEVLARLVRDVAP